MTRNCRIGKIRKDGKARIGREVRKKKLIVVLTRRRRKRVISGQ